MTTMLTGTVVGGRVELDGPPPPDGTKVRVAVDALTPPPAGTPDNPDEPTLAFMLKFAGCVPGLPADFADQHDHYIHGTPKR